MNHISIDLETFSTGPYSLVTSVGMVKFDPYTGEKLGEFFTHIDVNDQIQRGLRMDPNTVIWWLQQSEEARKKLCEPYDKTKLIRPIALSTVAACEAINQFLNKSDQQAIKNHTIVWGNGPGFDCNILRDLFKVVGIEPQWNYWNERCVRTAVDLAGIDKKKMKREGVHHNAIDDAMFQAQLVAEAFKVLKV